MGTSKRKSAATADPKAELQERVAHAKAIYDKNKGKEKGDAKRRLAHKKLKRAQRQLGKVEAAEKKTAAAKKEQPPA